MNLYEAAKQYLVYIQALRLPGDDGGAYRRVLRHVIWFYGANKPLEALDNATVLQYVKLYDPFDCNPVNEERGLIFCRFVEWLMHNRLIPAWAEEMESAEAWDAEAMDAEPAHWGGLAVYEN
jgi:hypothetical protein